MHFAPTANFSPETSSGFRRVSLHLFGGGFLRAAARRRQRRALASLDPHLLLDIGLTEAERAREVRRIF